MKNKWIHFIFLVKEVKRQRKPNYLAMIWGSWKISHENAKIGRYISDIDDSTTEIRKFRVGHLWKHLLVTYVVGTGIISQCFFLFWFIFLQWASEYMEGKRGKKQHTGQDNITFQSYSVKWVFTEYQLWFSNTLLTRL